MNTLLLQIFGHTTHEFVLQLNLFCVIFALGKTIVYPPALQKLVNRGQFAM